MACDSAGLNAQVAGRRLAPDHLPLLLAPARRGPATDDGSAGAHVLANGCNRAARGLYAACGGQATPAARRGDGVIMFSGAPSLYAGRPLP